MKKIVLSITAAALLLSCSKDDFDVNSDPDLLSPSDIALKTEFPAGIAGVAGAQGSYYALIGGFWSQHFTQGNSSNQYKEIDDYSIGTNDYVLGWTAMYDALGDLRNVKRLANEQGNWKYYLMATTLEVHASQIMADFYDQIPYDEANNVNILQPAFQTQEAVYDRMVADLKDALSKDLSASTGETPGNDDFVFAGNMDNWTAYANTLLLKLYLRQTEVRPSVASAGVTELLNSGVAFLDTDAAMTQFEDAPDRSNPLYETDRRQLNTGLNIRASRTLYSYLDENNDPRMEDYYNAGGPLNQGDFNNTGPQTSFAVVKLSATTPVYFMSHEESLFLQAEARERYAAGAGAKANYDAAVTEMFSKYGHSAAAYIAPGGAYEYPTGGSLQDKIKAIIVQKWTSFFPGNGFEAFFEQNRTGYPEVSPVPQTSESYVPGEFSYSVNGTTGGQFPKRLVFPSNVTTTNQNAPALIPVTTPVWWDAN
ncbi:MULTISPECIES: SusD/RagB family nutrient-binding outer membrane lipoprotein [unclassified Flavobacterium]|uniref:SusD/RagB family nutrient-binding outer membrane lipoprotein n=1 Tax=unclassified Flavobacterium TaxID=196869 RepID=UPI001F14013B|nr:MULTISPECIES: SusD/RagB family nutrient-binding outer membrane lipoprotein [unclassified Flavobacterium]UMY66968.1 SusD/RagB family nutrient-binding outer membrane lipoprotein [Flavobacterium sp. HJ-32-4]